LKEYHTTPSNKKYGIDNLPTEDLRLYAEEIKSQVDWERETMQGEKKQLSTVKEEDEFSFDNSRNSKDHDSHGKSTLSTDKDAKSITSE